MNCWKTLQKGVCGLRSVLINHKPVSAFVVLKIQIGYFPYRRGKTVQRDVDEIKRRHEGERGERGENEAKS